MKVANLRVRRISVDAGSSTDIISMSCLEKLKFQDSALKPINHPLIGCGGGVIHPIGVVTLLVRIGDKDQARNLFVRFLVVQEMTAYNIILGRLTLSSIKVVVVPHLMLIKFVCNDGSVGSL